MQQCASQSSWVSKDKQKMRRQTREWISDKTCKRHGMFGELVCWYSLLVKNVEENERRICWRTQHIHCTASLCAMLVKKTRLKSAAYCLQPQRSQCLPHSIYLTTHCSVTKLCLTLCKPMDCSIPGFPVLHYLLELAQTHVH